MHQLLTMTSSLVNCKKKDTIDKKDLTSLSVDLNDHPGPL